MEARLQEAIPLCKPGTNELPVSHAVEVSGIPSGSRTAAWVSRTWIYIPANLFIRSPKNGQSHAVQPSSVTRATAKYFLTLCVSPALDVPSECVAMRQL